MGRTREYTARTVVSFSIEAQRLKELDQIAATEKKERTAILQELVDKFVQKRLKTPNPQATLDVRPYPNLWGDGEFDPAEFPTDELAEMDGLAAPKLQAIQGELAKRRGEPTETRDAYAKALHGQREPNKMTWEDVEFCVKNLKMTREEAVAHLKGKGYTE